MGQYKNLICLFCREKMTNCDPTKSVEQILNQFQMRAINSNDTTKIVIFRRKVLESAYMAMARPSFKLCAKLYVKFSGEMGQDCGGPRREFFRYIKKLLYLSRSLLVPYW